MRIVSLTAFFMLTRSCIAFSQQIVTKFSIVFENHFNDAADTLGKQLGSFLSDNQVDFRSKCFMIDPDNWLFYEHKNVAEQVDYLRKINPQGTVVFKISVEYAKEEVDEEALKLTIRVLDLTASVKDFTEINFAYFYSPQLKHHLQLVKDHLLQIINGKGIINRKLYVVADKMLIKNCDTYKNILLRFFSNPPLHKTFCILSSLEDRYPDEIFGKMIDPKKPDNLKFVYKQKGKVGIQAIILNCDMDNKKEGEATEKINSYCKDISNAPSN